MLNIKSGIYKIVNLVNGKVYVGSAKTLNHRKAQHFYALRENMHDNSYLQNSYNFYGKYLNEIFVFRIIEYIEDIDFLIGRENYWINIYKANQRKHGYNLKVIAESSLGWKHSKETLIKISNNSKNISDETRQKMRNAKLGRKVSSEEREKRSNSTKGKNNPNFGKYGKNSPNFGKQHSIKSKEKMSVSRVGKKTKISGSSKYVGVRTRTNGKSFSAIITFMKITYCLGTFFTEEGAATAYNEKAKELLGIDYDINIVDKKED